MESKYSIRFDKKASMYDVYLSGFEPMYCASYKTKEEAKAHIKTQKKYYKANP